MKGWISLHRSIMTSWIWDDAKAFQRWICLLMFAAWEDTEMKFHNKRVKVKRGQLVTSKRQLARRWHTNNRIVSALLQDFVFYEMISMETKDNMTLITVLNYDKYQYNSGPEKYLKLPREEVMDEGKIPENMAAPEQNRLHKRSHDIINNKNNNKLKNIFTPEARALELKYFEVLKDKDQLFTDETMEILEVKNEEIPQLLETFKEEQLRKEKTHDNINDYQRHFHDWLKIKKENEKKRTKTKRNTAGTKAGAKTQPANNGGTEKNARTDGEATDSPAEKKNGDEKAGRRRGGNPLGNITIRKTETDD